MRRITGGVGIHALGIDYGQSKGHLANTRLGALARYVSGIGRST
jgi:hypothetical protein